MSDVTLPGARDHPRSRGVYSERISGGFAHAGSSPLARGLPKLEAKRRDAKRIIPARAGFTLAEQESNGENVGSSPLARGLLS